ncbi:uncharacterized protein LOC126786480 [Argentina anserina]|uniref:uncharacterized protein LOC126786480 n=1 Tax=Argentina anserina TaxID=57926 RepID=UPI0021764336|nr:uncharacterized protein LOC126786480 [Potentilla anserina]
MGLKDKKKTKKLAQRDLEPVEKDKKSGLSKMKKRKRDKENNGDSRKVVHISIEDSAPTAANDKQRTKKLKKGKVKKVKNSRALDGQRDPSNPDGFDVLNGISNKSQKKKTRDMNSSNSEKSLEKKEEANHEDVYLISSEDEGIPKGMKKWIMEYQQNRPGLKVLQERIDEFIIAHEAKLEQERKDREALSAEEGWQLVQHHKGRKKTKDADGITVGSVAQVVVETKRAKKKNTDVGLDFYRFQRKEAQRNEIMMLQSKFEQDKKRIQQIRAARKFKPY